MYYKSLLVSHGELVCLLFVAACQFIFDARHQIFIRGAADCPLDHIQPPGRVQLNLQQQACFNEMYRVFINILFYVSTFALTQMQSCFSLCVLAL